MNKRTVLAICLVILLFILFAYIIMGGIVRVKSAKVYLNPYMSTAKVGQSVTVDVNISDVVNLFGWELKMRWNKTLLDGIKVIEGPFLKQSSNTLFRHTINNTEGFLLVDCTLLYSVPGVSGSGTLATVEFNVKSIGECSLDLYDTILVSSLEQPISHEVTNGCFNAIP